MWIYFVFNILFYVISYIKQLNTNKTGYQLNMCFNELNFENLPERGGSENL